MTTDLFGSIPGSHSLIYFKFARSNTITIILNFVFNLLLALRESVDQVYSKSPSFSLT